MGMIYFQIGVILCLVLLLALVAYGDWKATKEREAEDAAKAKEKEAVMRNEPETSSETP